MRGEVLGFDPTVDGVFGNAKVGSDFLDADPTFFGRHVVLSPYYQCLHLTVKV